MAMRVVSAKVSRTAAMSARNTTAPEGALISGIRANSSAQSLLFFTRSKISPPSVSSFPPGISRDALSMVSAT